MELSKESLSPYSTKNRQRDIQKPIVQRLLLFNQDFLEFLIHSLCCCHCLARDSHEDVTFRHSSIAGATCVDTIDLQCRFSQATKLLHPDHWRLEALRKTHQLLSIHTFQTQLKGRHNQTLHTLTNRCFHQS